MPKLKDVLSNIHDQSHYQVGMPKNTEKHKKRTLISLLLLILFNNPRKKYIKLEKINSSHAEKIFEQMPKLKDVSSNIDDQTHYQGAMPKNTEHEKENLEKRSMSCIIQNIIKCF